MVEKNIDNISEIDNYNEEEDTQKDKYLMFKLAKEVYAIEIKYVTEIIGIQKITEIPETENYIKGVINLRGKVIPVIDIRLRFKFDPKPYGDRTCIIIVNIDDMALGLIVDEVSEVLDIPDEFVGPPPKTNKGTHSKFIKGLGRIKNGVKIILDVYKILNEDQLDEIKDLGD